MPLTGVRKKRARKKYGIVGKADLFSGFGDSYADKSTTYSKAVCLRGSSSERILSKFVQIRQMFTDRGEWMKLTKIQQLQLRCIIQVSLPELPTRDNEVAY